MSENEKQKTDKGWYFIAGGAFLIIWSVFELAMGKIPITMDTLGEGLTGKINPHFIVTIVLVGLSAWAMAYGMKRLNLTLSTLFGGKEA